MTRTTAVNAPPRPIRAIVADIRAEWGDKLDTTGYAARPYVTALLTVDTITDTYGAESAEHLVRGFLANAAQFKGERARYLKEELRALLPRRR